MTSETQSSGENRKSPIERLITNPIYGAITGICSVIGIPLAIYLYLAARAVPELSYYVSPTRTAIVSAAEASGLTVQYEGQQIRGDLSSVLVTIWNAGGKPILHSDILSPIVLRLGGEHPILDAKEVNEVRALIGFKIDSAQKASGILRVDWNILEHNDGARIQVIYQGNAHVPVFVRGAIIGQQAPARLAYREPGSEQEESPTQYVAITLAMSILLMLIAALGHLKDRERNPSGKFRFYLYIAMPVAVVMLGVAMYQIYNTLWAAPPFGL